MEITLATVVAMNALYVPLVIVDVFMNIPCNYKFVWLLEAKYSSEVCYLFNICKQVNGPVTFGDKSMLFVWWNMELSIMLTVSQKILQNEWCGQVWDLDSPRDVEIPSTVHSCVNM